MPFQLRPPYPPRGDQPQAIDQLAEGLERGQRYQTLLGVTGSGKTYTVANVIQRWGRPTLVISHNKTLAAQLYGEFRQFFPESAVGYFVSYYDYYQPEAYVASTNTYIAKDANINDDIDRLRLQATSMLLEREDVIIVASVSCIYGLGAPEDWRGMRLDATAGERVSTRRCSSSWSRSSTPATTSRSAAGTSGCAATWSRCTLRTRTPSSASSSTTTGWRASRPWTR